MLATLPALATTANCGCQGHSRLRRPAFITAPRSFFAPSHFSSPAAEWLLGESGKTMVACGRKGGSEFAKSGGLEWLWQILAAGGFALLCAKACAAKEASSMP